MKISDFCNSDLVDYASYSTIRAIGSLVDGQKNAARKILHTVLDKNIRNEIKVSQLASKMAEHTEYLHGAADGVITNLAQNYIGTNNLNLLEPEGNFGTRHSPEPSASRYIMTYGSKTLFNIFKKDDNAILISQEFEGTKIEPKFFVPTLPLILINGSEGIATGFAQKILPRDVNIVKEYIEKSIKGEELPDLVPMYKGFKGIIEKGDNDNQWLIKGTFERTSLTKIMITELPIGYNLKSYTKVLDDLEDKKIIRDYTDLSDSKKDEFKFEVQMDSKSIKNEDDWLLDKLKLVKKVTENFTVIDENNRVVAYNSPEEVINHYIKVKLKYVDKRKSHLIEKMNKDILLNASRYLFIKNVTEGNIVVNKQKKEAIIEQLDKPEFDKIIKDEDSYDYLLRMPIYNLTEERMEELKNKIIDMKKELTIIKETSAADMWSKEIAEIC